MLVVSDTTPISTLCQVDAIHVLPALFGQVLIPSAVLRELSHHRAPEAVQRFLQATPSWIAVRDPSSPTKDLNLDEGEQAAIELACELSADLIPINDRDGRLAAARRGLQVVGTLGVVERAIGAGLLELEAAEKLRTPAFRVADELIDAMFERLRKRPG